MYWNSVFRRLVGAATSCVLIIAFGCGLISGIVASIAPAHAQMVVSDPVLQSTAARIWGTETATKIKMTEEALTAAQQLSTQVQQTAYQAQNAHTLAQWEAVWTNGQAEYKSLNAIVKMGNAITAANSVGAKQVDTVFPKAQQGQQASALAKTYYDNSRSSIQTGLNYLNIRTSQMNSEEANITALMAHVNDPNIGTNKLLQILSGLANQQIQELRNIQRLMQQQYATELSMWASLGQTNSGVQAVVQTSHMQMMLGMPGQAIPAGHP